MRPLAIVSTVTFALACHATGHSVAEVRYAAPTPIEAAPLLGPLPAPLPAESPRPRPAASRAPSAWRAPARYPAARVGVEHDILRWTNVERFAAGLAPLAWSETLAHAARAHSAEMARLGYFDHTSPNPATRSPLVRAQRAGLRGDRLFVAENIAMGTFRSDHARHIVKLWMDSPGHRENILRRNVRYLGVGVAHSGRDLYATQVFSSTP